jgi:hypothetical protein
MAIQPADGEVEDPEPCGSPLLVSPGPGPTGPGTKEARASGNSVGPTLSVTPSRPEPMASDWGGQAVGSRPQNSAWLTPQDMPSKPSGTEGGTPLIDAGKASTHCVRPSSTAAPVATAPAPDGGGPWGAEPSNSRR